jgi:hypothetical protein
VYGTAGRKTDWALTGRNSVTNEQYWLMSVRLAAFTNDQKYLDPDTDILKWFDDGFAEERLFDPGA